MRKLLTRFFILLVAFKLFIDFELFKALFTWNLDFYALLFVVPAVALPIGTYIFYKGKSEGWNLMTGYFIFVIYSILFHFLRSKNIGMNSIEANLYFLIPYFSNWTFAVGLAISTFSMVGLFNRGVLKEFKVSKRQMALTVTVSLVLAFYANMA